MLEGLQSQVKSVNICGQVYPLDKDNCFEPDEYFWHNYKHRNKQRKLKREGIEDMDKSPQGWWVKFNFLKWADSRYSIRKEFILVQLQDGTILDKESITKNV